MVNEEAPPSPPPLVVVGLQFEYSLGARGGNGAFMVLACPVLGREIRVEIDPGQIGELDEFLAHRADTFAKQSTVTGALDKVIDAWFALGFGVSMDAGSNDAEGEQDDRPAVRKAHLAPPVRGEGVGPVRQTGGSSEDQQF